MVVTFSGCPGDGADAQHPNWVTTPWPPEFLDVLDWQWDRRRHPLLDATPRSSPRDHGVKVALEAASRLPRLQRRDARCGCARAAGPKLGVNFDPSHFFWQGMDVPAVPSARSATRSSTCTPRTWRSNAAERRRQRRARHQELPPHGRAVVAVPHRRLGPRRARMEADRQRAAARRLRLRDEHRARGRAGLGRTRACGRRWICCPACCSPSRRPTRGGRSEREPMPDDDRTRVEALDADVPAVLRLGRVVRDDGHLARPRR